MQIWLLLPSHMRIGRHVGRVADRLRLQVTVPIGLTFAVWSAEIDTLQTYWLFVTLVLSIVTTSRLLPTAAEVVGHVAAHGRDVRIRFDEGDLQVDLAVQDDCCRCR